MEFSFNYQQPKWFSPFQEAITMASTAESILDRNYNPGVFRRQQLLYRSRDLDLCKQIELHKSFMKTALVYTRSLAANDVAYIVRPSLKAAGCGSCTTVVLQPATNSIKQTVIRDMITTLLESAFPVTLRKDEQLGYVPYVHHREYPKHDTSYLSFSIGGEEDPVTVTKKIANFLKGFKVILEIKANNEFLQHQHLQTKIYNMTEHDFENLMSTLRMKLNAVPGNPEDSANMYWERMLSREGYEDWAALKRNALRGISLTDIQEEYKVCHALTIPPGLENICLLKISIEPLESKAVKEAIDTC